MDYHHIDYKIINIDSKTTESKCIKADSENLKLYQKATKSINKSFKKIKKKTNIDINTNIAKPPKPSNYDRLLIFRNNTITKPCYKQSLATIYLYEKGYVLDRDYYASDAIQFAKKIKSNKKISKKRINYQNRQNTEEITIIKTNSRNTLADNHSIYPNISNRRNSNYISNSNRNSNYISNSNRNSNYISNNFILEDENNINNIDNLSLDSDDESQYGFVKKLPMPSAPPYEETNYIITEEYSKC